jgi:hypothetical protein
MTVASAPSDLQAPPQFRVMPVLSRALGILTRNIGKFFLLSVGTLLPVAVVAIVGAGSVAANGPGGAPTISSGALFAGAAGLILFGLLMLLSQAIMLYGAFQAMRGRRFGIGESIRHGLSRLLAIIGVMFLMGVVVMIGFVLLVIPGVIAAIALFVTLPACVVEKLAPVASLKRSAALTKGHRWRIFGLYFLMAIVLGILGQIVGALAGLLLGVVVGPLVAFAWQALASAYQSIVVAVAYHDLRVLKDGLDIDQIAAVFD